MNSARSSRPPRKQPGSLNTSAAVRTPRRKIHPPGPPSLWQGEGAGGCCPAPPEPVVGFLGLSSMPRARRGWCAPLSAPRALRGGHESSCGAGVPSWDCGVCVVPSVHGVCRAPGHQQLSWGWIWGDLGGTPERAGGSPCALWCSCVLWWDIRLAAQSRAGPCPSPRVHQVSGHRDVQVPKAFFGSGEVQPSWRSHPQWGPVGAAKYKRVFSPHGVLQRDPMAQFWPRSQSCL